MSPRRWIGFLGIGLLALALETACASSTVSDGGLIAPAAEQTSIAGTLEQGRYRAPGRRFSIAVPPLFQPGSQASDGFEGDAFSVLFRDNLGQLFVVEELPRGEDSLRETLGARLEDLRARHGAAVLAREEEVRLKHENGLFAVVEVPAGSGYRVLDASSRSQGGQRVAGLLGYLLFDRPPNRYVLRAQESLLLDIGSGLGSGDPPSTRERWKALRDGLDELAATMRFDGS
jgi:hypothetical protein